MYSIDIVHMDGNVLGEAAYLIHVDPYHALVQADTGLSLPAHGANGRRNE